MSRFKISFNSHVQEPRDMFDKIVQLFAKRFLTNFCLLYIADVETDILELWGVEGKKEIIEEVSQRYINSTM